MKSFKLIIAVMAFAMVSFTIVSCGNKKKSDKDGVEASADADKQGKEYTSNYICPMHCKASGSDKAGKCPVCGMDYKKNEDHKSDGHDHDGDDHDGSENEGHDDDGEDHSGHDHDHGDHKH